MLIDEAGRASTHYFNGLTAGFMFAGAMWGLAATRGGYRGAFVACLLLAAASTALLTS